MSSSGQTSESTEEILMYFKSTKFEDTMKSYLKIKIEDKDHFYLRLLATLMK
jgi:hypothetical protein